MSNKVFTSNIETVYVAGDLHGDYDSFKRILNIYKEAENGSLLLFLGDYADRGPYGVEVITGLNDMLDKSDNIVALKGNHEMYINGKPCFYPCSLTSEAKDKYTSWEKFYKVILLQFFSKLNIGAIINNVLFIHAGVSTNIKSMADLENTINEQTILWSDPSPFHGEHVGIRGAGVAFGEDITDTVLNSLGLRLIVRSHEPMKAVKGPYVEHSGKVITINSCASYGESMKRFILKINTISLNYEPVFL